MKNQLLTIITPVYNRAGLMMRLYESLINQTNKNFRWLVVDDGSKDEIEETMIELMGKANFPIEFYRKKNGGKHTALNLAFEKIETELSIIVDSDDWLVPTATDSIEKIWCRRMERDVAGCIFLRGHEDGTCIGRSELPDGTYDMIHAMFSHHIEGDKAEVFRSDILKQYRFPEFPDEHFLGEDYVWRQIYLKYHMVYVNAIIYICEYLEGGLTRQGRKLRIECPLGGMENSKVSFDKRFPLRERIKRAWLFVCYGKFAHLNFKSIVKKSGAQVLIMCNYIPGVLLYKYWKELYF